MGGTTPVSRAVNASIVAKLNISFIAHPPQVHHIENRNYSELCLESIHSACFVCNFLKHHLELLHFHHS